MTRAFLFAAATALVLGALPRAVAADQAPPPNAIQAENALPGTTAWQAPLAGGTALYATQIAVAPGDRVDLHVSTADRYRLVVYRMGWYGGTGARQMACVPSCTTDEQGSDHTAVRPSNLPYRANWPVSDSFQTQTTWTSGYYLVEALVTAGPRKGHVATTWFVVHPPPTTGLSSQILVQVPVNTWEAYNDWAGSDFYNTPTSQQVIRISFQRPFSANAPSPLLTEIQLVRFLEREGYDVSYQTDLDTDLDPSSLLRHRLVIVNGHDEYWTMRQRQGFDDALAAGTNLAFMGSNDGYWHVEYEDGGQTIFSYKSTDDPNPDPAMKTAMFRSLGRPECQLEGVQHTSLVISTAPLDYTVTDAGAADPWLAGTGLTAGSAIAGIVGREHDGTVWGCAPSNAVDLFHYQGADVDQNGDAVRYTAPSGARVFSSGAFDFTWSLDAYRSDGSPSAPLPVVSDRTATVDSRVQTFMDNALDDLTRPPPPPLVRKVSDGGRLRVQTGWPADARVVGRVVYRVREDDGSWQLVCSGHSPCFPGRASGPGKYHFAVSYVDVWGASSAPTVSTSWTRR